jgi:hypothetical protein
MDPADIWNAVGVGAGRTCVGKVGSGGGDDGHRARLVLARGLLMMT